MLVLHRNILLLMLHTVADLSITAVLPLLVPHPIRQLTGHNSQSVCSQQLGVACIA